MHEVTQLLGLTNPAIGVGSLLIFFISPGLIAFNNLQNYVYKGHKHSLERDFNHYST